MPNGQSQVPADPNTPYTAIDPQKQPLEFMIQNKDALRGVSPRKASAIIDQVFRMYMLPRYQAVNRQKPLDPDEVEALSVRFKAMMLGIPGAVPFEGKNVFAEKPGLAMKAGAALTGAGAGVMGGLRTIADLNTAINKHLGPIGEPSAYLSGKASQIIGKQEGKSYEEAKTVSPEIASRSAAIGHQIPAMIASGGVESAFPKLAAGAPAALKMARGAAQQAAGGAAYGASVPGGKPAEYAAWGGVLGAVFPGLAAMFGRGRSATGAAERGAVEAGEKAGAAAPPTEAKPTIESIKADIAAQRAAKETAKKAARETKKAALEAKKAATTGEAEGKRAAKEQMAKATATAQAEQRAAGMSPTPTAVPEATAKAAVAENPQIKISPATPEKIERRVTSGTSPTGTERRVLPGVYERSAMAQPTAGEKLAEDIRKARAGTPSNITEGDAIQHIQKDPKKWEEFVKAEPKAQDKMKIEAKNELLKIQKVPESQAGKKIRAKAGQSASPAQQKADAERIAATRAKAKQEEFGAALEKHAQGLAGRFVGKLEMQNLPELEESIKELEGGSMILKEMGKYRRAGKINDEEYFHQLKEWFEDQLSKGE